MQKLKMWVSDKGGKSFIVEEAFGALKNYVQMQEKLTGKTMNISLDQAKGIGPKDMPVIWFEIGVSHLHLLIVFGAIINDLENKSGKVSKADLGFLVL